MARRPAPVRSLTAVATLRASTTVRRTGSDGADGADGGDGADGTDDGGPPSWIGVNPLVYELETPRGDLLCEGTMDLELSAAGEGVGYDECVLLEGPGEGREMGVKLVVQVADVASEDSRLSGEAYLTRAEGDEMGSGALDGVVEGGAFDLAFEVDGIGPDGDRTLLGVAFSP